MDGIGSRGWEALEAPQSVGWLGVDTVPLRRIRPGMEKYNLPVAERQV